MMLSASSCRPEGIARIEVVLGGMVGKGRKGEVALHDAPAKIAVPALVALLAQLAERSIAHQVRGGQQRARERVDAADMRQVQVGRVHRLAAQLGIEVEAAGAEAAVLHQLHHRRHQFLGIVGKLVGVPAIARIAAVHVDGTEDAVGPRDGDLVLEVHARQRGVIDLDVDLDLLGQPARAELQLVRAKQALLESQDTQVADATARSAPS